jgi:hypothetical protein
MGWATLLFSALTIHAEDISSVSSAESTRVEEVLASGLKACAAEVGVDPDRSPCRGQPRCLLEVGGRRGATWVVTYSVLGGVTENLVVGELWQPERGRLAQTQVALQRQASTAAVEAQLLGLAEELCASLPIEARPPLPKTATVEAGRGPWPWIALAAAGGSLAAGTVFAVRADQAQSELQAGLRFEDRDLTDLRDRANRERWLAIGLLGSGLIFSLIGIGLELNR